MKKLILVIVVVFFANSICMGGERRQKFLFVGDYIKSLGQLRALEEQRSAFNRQYKNDLQYSNSTVTFLNSYNSNLLTARALMSKYEDSEIQIIKDAASSILFIYDNLSNIQLEALRMFEELNRSGITNNLENFNLESFADKSTELDIKHEKFMEAFADVSLMVTYVLVSWEPDEDGKLSYLAISQSERDALTKQLDKTFDNELKNGITGGQTHLNTCGAILRKVLTGEHKSFDDR